MKAFVIFLAESPKSKINVGVILDRLIEFNLDAQAFNGVPGNLAIETAKKQNMRLWPYNVKGKKIDHDDVDWRKLSRPGVIGCFLSHYQLWQRCLEINEPLMIFEDDVKFYRSWIPVSWQDVLILSLGKKSTRKDPWKSHLENPVGGGQSLPWPNRSMPGTSGYAIMPQAAQKLVDRYRGYWTASDNAINCDVCDIEIHSHVMGRHMTAQEGNISLTKKKW
jgi:GR25 family glycosyltransferase involved in LPS biosynthesis